VTGLWANKAISIYPVLGIRPNL